MNIHVAQKLQLVSPLRIRYDNVNDFSLITDEFHANKLNFTRRGIADLNPISS